MGAPATEAESNDNERPQHKVTVPAFYMGKFQVTQKLWKAVASLPKIERELKPDPSSFKGDNRPVESITWYDAVEFCKRLSKKTGREYRLPSESEWEYACRAGTTTPFYFGETITTDLVNYNGNYTYAGAPKGQYRQETTPVGQFPPNAFGLYDMHGNVWEWCADYWHDNYNGAPTNGSAWLSENENDYRLLRGGSWYFNARNCRSAYRNRDNAGNAYNNVGLRLACGAART
jgi:formylglycine-generating enzyme required for sulfatase activity